MGAFEVLQSRGYVQQCTHPEELREALNAGPVTFYVGFDATASSLHVGSMFPLMVMANLQRLGHKVIALVGGGTTRVGDPSGKTELRQMLSDEQIAENSAGLREQISRFLVLDGERGVMVDNADWLLELKYIPFLRDIGRQFSVNRMLAAEAYKQRLERGLSFIEFNYQILQAYDFLELFRRHGCRLQIGGDDQWGNIVAGVDLVRRMEGVEVWGLTHPLLTTSAGAKMGKSAAGAVWIDAARTSPFDLWQYWYNVDDRDVVRWLNLYTFLPDHEIAGLGALRGADLRDAKRVLATAVTTIVHGAEAAAAAEAGARAMVGAVAAEDLPTTPLSEPTRLSVALELAGLAKSRSEARRLVAQGGVTIDGERVDDPEHTIDPAASVVVRVGKKRATRFVPAG
ncbi:MAG: tyrosine--tRNA ligase [Myxococcota bacterium]